MSGNLIRGAGGGGKGGGGSARVAQEDPDSLRSRQYARVLDAICEGEIVGLVDGAKSVYLDDTPLQNADGSYNFQNVVLNTTTGTQSQAYLPGYSDVESEVAVSAEVKNSASVTRSITNTNANRARVTLSVPQLTSQDTTNGDLHGAEVSLSIQLQVYVNGVGGGFSTVWTDTIRGKTTTKYQRAYNVNLTKPANCTGWDIRVVRNTADSGSAALVNKTWWDSYTEIVDVKLGYPNTALVGISIDASQFRAIPRRAYDVKLLKIKVPVNYDPVTRVYTGVWDGTFKTAWSDNPAWCFYDMLTNARYGLGEFISTAQVDKWTLYNIAQYCDEMVPNGFGGQEPRFTCNLYLQTREEAYKVINDMASIFRAMVYWASGAIFASQDRPSDPVALFTPANVIDGLFHYEGSARRSRYTVALVSWNDPSDRYRQKIEYVEDAAGIARYGVVQTEVAAIGCTSRGQAHRMGQWILYSVRTETETVSFDIGLFDVRKVFPGAVIKVADAARAGKRWGGLIMAATTGAITVDALTDGSTNSITIETAKTYTLSVVLPDGTVASSTVINAPGSNVTVLAVSPVFSSAPQQHAIWVLEEASLVAQPLRVLTITETAKHTAKVVALEHNPSKFPAVEQGLALQALPISNIVSSAGSPVSGITTTESLYIVAGDIKSRLHIGWIAPAGASRYRVEYRLESGNWLALPEVMAPAAELLDITIGTYTLRISAISWLGLSSLPVTYVVDVAGKTAPPANITSATVVRNGKKLTLTWSAVPDLDLDHYEWRLGATWEAAIPVPMPLSKATSLTLDSYQAGTYLGVAVDTSAHRSVTPIVVIIPELPGNVLIARNDSGTGVVGGGALNLHVTQWAPSMQYPYIVHPLRNFTPAARSIALWVKPAFDLAGMVAYPYLWSTTDSDVYDPLSGNHNHLVLYLDVDTGPVYYLRMVVVDASGNAQTHTITITSSEFTSGQWTHIVATYSASGIKLYARKVGGSRLSGASGAITAPSAIPSGAIGRVSWGLGGSWPFDGQIDGLRIYNRELSAAEVEEHFGFTYNNDSGLVLAYDFEDGVGSTVFDGSSNQNHANIQFCGAVPATYPWVTPGIVPDAWRGVKTNMVADGAWLKTNAATGAYETVLVDAGAVMPCLVELSPVVEQVGAGATTIATTYEISTKDTLGGAWGNWQTFVPGAYQARYFKFRASFTNSDLANYARLKSLGVVLDVPDRIAHFEDIVVPSGGLNLLIEPAFISARTALVTLQNAAVGDNYKVDVSAGVVRIEIYNVAGQAKSLTVDVDVSGYGSV